MRCQEVMKQLLACAKPLENVQAAARRMRDEGVGFLPVCDDDGRAVGVLTDRDLATRVCAENLPCDRTRVGQVMTKRLIACRPTDDVERALELMLRHGKTRILVTDADQRVLGVISRSDLARSEADLLAVFGLRAKRAS